MSKLRSLLQRMRKSLRGFGLRQAAAIAGRLPSIDKAASTAAAEVPPLEPSEDQLRRWALVEGLDYQVWAFHHSFVTLDQWRNQRREALDGDRLTQPLISVLTPVFNTPVEYLRECIYSVQVQSYPYWELCLVDDASTDPATIAELDKLVDSDPRIRMERLQANSGICGATNSALAMATGSYIAFLDHDDRLAPDALHHVAALLMDDPNVDVVYSDRDFINADNVRTNPLFKPHWAPETLLAGNYLFHLVVYRRSLAEQLGGYRQEFEGSQDLDLALRAAETSSTIAHLALVLYHWRQHDASMAGKPDAKPYIFEAGMAAVRGALDRREISGVVDEIPDIWRGNYRVHLDPVDEEVELISISDVSMLRSTVAEALTRSDAKYVVITEAGIEVDEQGLEQLVAWLRQPQIAATTPRLVGSDGRLRHTGLVRHRSGLPVAPYSGDLVTEPGHGVMNMIVRNTSLVHPLACAWRADVLEQCLGMSTDFEGPFSMLDASIRAEQLHYRLMYVPLATFTADAVEVDPTTWSEGDAASFAEEHGEAVAYDWYYNWALDRDNPDGRIGYGAPAYRSDLEG